MVYAQRNLKKGRVTGIYSLQSVLVNEIPCHIKDLHPHHRSISSDDDSSDILSENDSSKLLLFRAESDDSPAVPEEIMSIMMPRTRENLWTQRGRQTPSKLYKEEFEGDHISPCHCLSPGTKCTHMCLACQIHDRKYS